MELVKGQVVTSRSGRDVTRAYVVTEVRGERVLLADGAKRPLAAPKPKNPRHIQPTNTVLPGAEWDTDEKLRKALSAWQKAAESTKQGG